MEDAWDESGKNEWNKKKVFNWREKDQRNEWNKGRMMKERMTSLDTKEYIWKKKEGIREVWTIEKQWQIEWKNEERE